MLKKYIKIFLQQDVIKSSSTKGAIEKRANELEEYVDRNIKNMDKILRENGNELNAKGIENYMKNMPFQYYGIKSPEMKTIFKSNYESKAKYEENFLLAYHMIQSNIFQHKLYGMSILQKINKEIKTHEVNFLKTLIEESYVQGWALCDTLAKIFRLVSLNRGKEVDEILFAWKFQKENTWIRRTALVTFVLRAKYGDESPNYAGFMDELYNMCEECLKYDERFNQLGIGWLLREMTLGDKVRTIEFIKKHYNKFIRQSLRYAVQKLPNKQKTELMAYNEQQDKQEAKQKKKVIKKVKN